MGQKKLIRFKEINSFSNVLQYPENMRGQWKHFFKNANPVNLELACGKGEYAVGLAQIHPDENYVGVDIKGNRLWVGAKESMDKKLTNTAFLRTQIEKITDYFEPGEVHQVWVTFPDPQLRKSKAKKRLTHPNFLRLYQKIMQPGGYIHLKTDSPDLYRFTKSVIDYYGLTIISDIPNLYKLKILPPELSIKTYYETLDIAHSNKVFYLCFTLPGELTANDETFTALIKNEDLNLHETRIT